MKNIDKFIGTLPLFKGLSPQQIQHIRGIVVTRKLRKGELIFSEGDDGNGFYVAVRGQVKIFKLSLEGKEKILHIFGPGEPFGEVPVFSGENFPANAQATADSELLFFPRQAFVDLIAHQPSLALKMLAILSQRLRQFTIQIEHLALKEVPERLAAYLLYLSQEQGTSASVTLQISKGQLASLLGTIPETLSRMLSRMSSQGYIRVAGREIQLLDPDGLQALAEHGKLLV
jgi:CRP/FNR family transcriptional regulator